MKYITILLLTAFVFCTGSAQKNSMLDKPKVDERVELLSIVARLAGYNEYSMTLFKVYTDKIENHFSPYKGHEVVQFAKKMKRENSVGYDAVMAMAIHLDENLNPRTEFTDKIPEWRWGKDNAYEFVRLLKAFYKDAKCKEFFDANKDLYEEASARFQPIYEHIDLDWYSTFYGKEPSEKFIVINGLGNGGSNYGTSYNVPDEKKEVYAIMGAWTVDNMGMVVFNRDNYFPTLLHEFNHSFVNELLEKDKEPFKDSGEKIFAVVKDEMTRQAYSNWVTMLNEALVRAAVIKYMEDHNFSKKSIQNEYSYQLSLGFLWIGELVKELNKYDKQRDIYPTLESYMPKLAEAYNNYVEPIQKYNGKRPIITSISEFANGDILVSPSSIKEITINLDKPLLGEGYSIYYGNKGQDAFPNFGKKSYSNDKKSVILEVELEKNKEYQFVLKGVAFKTPEGVGINDYEVNFKTGK